MSSPDNKVRVFISSTFRDMHAERDHLVTAVFPELRERCERLGLEFFDVDLRWGVPDKNVDGESANSWEYCRKWINEAKPFFVCLLGQRYGWEPDGSAIKDDDALKAAQSNPDTQRSITDLEVHHALEHEGHSRRCFFYLRQAQAPDSATEFVDPAPDKRRKLERLKAHLRRCDRPVWDYPCEWKDDHFTGMEEFGKRVLADLWSGILRDPRYVSEEVWEQVLGTDPAKDSRYKDETTPVPEDIAEKLIPLAKPPPKNPLEAERGEMQRFADSRLRWFQGRKDELKQLTDFILAPAADNQPRLALLAAVPGQGKSALMAKLSQSLISHALQLSPSPSLFLVTHFVGATSHSSSSYHLVKRLLDELDASGIAFPERPTPEGQPKEEPKLDFQSLCQRLWDRLSDYPGETRIVILLDALNQLDDGHELGWLPYRLGSSVRIVVSCIEEPFVVPASAGHADGPDRVNAELPATPAEKVLTALDSRHPKPLRVPLKGITPEDVRSIVTEYLKEYCKELDAPHVDALCALPQSRNPLYLLVLLAELRTLGGNDMNKHVPALIADMGIRHPDTVSLFKWVLERLEQAESFGKEAVQAWCLYLALGRTGMSSRELSDLLKRKFRSDEAALTAQRIERGLRRYLQRRSEQLDFFHGQLRQAVLVRCGGEQRIVQRHHDIADFFRVLADPEGDNSWLGTSPRGFAELPFHLVGSGQMNEMRTLLSTLVYLAACIATSSAREILDDYVLHGEPLPSALIEWRDFLRKRLQVLAQDPGMLVALANHEGFLAAREQASKTTWSRPWLKTWTEVMPSRSAQPVTGMGVEVLKRMDWPEPRMATFASERQIAFCSERLGTVRVLDGVTMRELDSILSIRRERPLLLLCSPDAKAVVSFFESGEADLHRCVFDTSGRPVTLEIITTFRYFLPQCEDPVAVWHNDAFWFQSRPDVLAKIETETGIVTEEYLPPGLAGELAALVFTRSSRLVALRQNEDVILIAESAATLRCDCTDVYAACACDHESVVVAFTNGDLVAYDLAGGITQRSKARGGVVQGALGWDGTRLWWADNKLGCRSWEPQQSDIISVNDQGEIFPAGLLTSPRAWSHQSPGVTLLLASHGLLAFRLSGETLATTEVHRRLDGFFGGNVWCAVWMRDANHWFAAGCLQSEILLAGNELGRLCCAVDGRGHLFAVSGSGEGKIIDPATLHEMPIRNCLTLPNMASGDMERGCWFSDRVGCIYYVDSTGLCRQVAEVGLTFPQGSQLHSYGDYLVWSGLSNHWFPETGQEPAPTLVIFRRKFTPEMRIERLGEHVIHPRKGHCLALCFDAATERLVTFWKVEEGLGGYLLRLGRVEHFVEGRDLEECELVDLKMQGQFPKIALSYRGESLAVLGVDGTLSCVDVGTGRVIATLAPSSPLIAVAAGGSTTNFWIVGATGQVYRCDLLQPL